MELNFSYREYNNTRRHERNNKSGVDKEIIILSQFSGLVERLLTTSHSIFNSPGFFFCLRTHDDVWNLLKYLSHRVSHHLPLKLIFSFLLLFHSTRQSSQRIYAKFLWNVSGWTVEDGKFDFVKWIEQWQIIKLSNNWIEQQCSVDAFYKTRWFCEWK